MNYESIRKNPDNYPYFVLDVPVFPHEQALKEAKNLPINLYYAHRINPNRRQDIYQFSIFGKQCNGKASFSDTDNYFTDEARTYLPTIVDYYENVFPQNYTAIRLASLKAGGSILPHIDNKQKGFFTPGRSSFNTAINMPKGVVWNIGKTTIPFRAGESNAIDFSIEHSVINNSTEDRYHLLIGVFNESTEFKRIVEDSYRKYIL